MKQPQKNTLHPAFTINGRGFATPKALLQFLAENHPHITPFVKDWFSESAYITLKTSGTTGTPKTITALKSAMRASAAMTGRYFDLKAGSKVLICLATDYIAGKMMWVRAIALGWSVNIPPNLSHPLSEVQNDCDFTAMTPAQLAHNLDKIHHVKKCLLGGAPLPKTLENKIHHTQATTQFYQSYAMTETLSHIAIRKLAQGTDTPYEALPKVSFSQDDRGCLVIKAPEITQKPIITNDLVTLIDTQKFYWLGRVDNIINSGGVKIIPEQIEKAIAPFMDKDFFIAGLADKTLGNKAVLIVEDERQDLHEKESILNYLKGASLQKYHRPKSIYFIPQFVRTASGKIQRTRTLLERTQK